MAGFTEPALEKKLVELNNSQQSIQTLSLWLIHHRKHHKSIVQVWFKELKKAKSSRRLTFMYLANDVIQNSKKKGPEFSREFGTILQKAFQHVALETDEKTRNGLERVLSVWEERNVYDQKQIEEFRQALGNKTPGHPTARCHLPVGSVPNVSVPQGKHELPILKSLNTKAHMHRQQEDKGYIQTVGEFPKTDLDAIPKKRKRESSPPPVLSSREEDIQSPTRSPPGEPPDPEELIKALQELENSASTDAHVREKIASLPPEVSDASLLGKIRDKESAEKLSKQVDEACSLLADYNSRLSQELEDRKKVSRLLSDFTFSQKEILAQIEQKLEEYRDKLRKVTQVRNELKSHLQNLPDLTLLPNVTGGLAPLPSAGDLFSQR